MNLAQALKNGIIPKTAKPIDIILTAYKENLNDFLQKQIKRHHYMMKNTTNVNEARKIFGVICDFNESEIARMSDLRIWMGEDRDNIIDTIEEIKLSMGILRSLRRKKIYSPIDDNMVNNCYKCGSIFGMFNRRHHCRACGRIFCHSCSQWTEYIPKDIINYINTKTWIIPDKMSRVCQSCKEIIGNFRRIEYLVQYFEIVAYPLDLCIKASTFSRDWREAMRIYLSNICDIQYYAPSTPLSDRDRRALLSNIHYIQGHSKWILQALKIGLIALKGRRIRKCQDMMCDRNCTETLTYYDAIIILNSTLYNIEVRLMAIKILEQTQFPPEITSFLPLEDLSVQEFIIKRQDLFLDFFWLSRINQGLSTDIFRNKLLLANNHQAISVQESLNLISLLDNYHNNLCELSKQLQMLKVPFIGPFGLIEKFDHDITVKTSATRPIIIKYYTNGIKRAFLYKREDIRKDSHIISLIRLMYHLCSDIFSSVTLGNSSFLPMSSNPVDISSSPSNAWVSKFSPLTSPRSLPNSCPIFSTPTLSLAPPIEPEITSTNYSKLNDFVFLPLTEEEFENVNNEPLQLLDIMKSIEPNSIGVDDNSTEEDNDSEKAISDIIREPNPKRIETNESPLIDFKMENVNVEAGVTLLPVGFEKKNHNNDDMKFLAIYRVMPISTTAGFIEIVPNAATLFDILNRGTISNYLYRSNVDKKVSEVSSNYSASLAFWTVITYILGVGDRHLENIMIRNDGILFHIDYGFVFGADSTASFVRLDHNLIEGLGGVEMYEPFKIRCCEIYCCLRKHFNLICACLMRLSSIQPPIKGYNFTSEFIEKFVTERLLPGQTEEEAKEAFSKIIDSSRETLINKVSDVIHNTVSTFKVGWWSY